MVFSTALTAIPQYIIQGRTAVKTLFSFQHDGSVYTLKGNNLGKEVLERDGETLSARRSLGFKSEHRFACPKLGPMRLRFILHMTNTQYEYWLETPGRIVSHGQGDYGHILPTWLRDGEAAIDNADGQIEAAVETPTPTPKPKPGSAHLVTLALLGLKLLKSAGALKAALAGTALAGWAWLFDLEFAIALITAILVHEFGHALAMKRCGLQVKGIYLIPFIGGVAINERSQSRWQDFQIAIAGPVLGSFGALLGWALWLYSGNSFLAIFAVVSLMLNIFNLLPIVPLDGGQTVKAIVFSRPGVLGRVLLLGLNAFLVVGSWYFGLTLLAFFGILGAVDLIFTGKADMQKALPMNTSGMLVATVTYLGLIGLLVALSISMASSGLDGANLPLVFLQS